MQKNITFDVNDLLKATNQILKSNYESPALTSKQKDIIKNFITQTINTNKRSVVKKINLELL
ncbi:hypothetical protein OAL69_00580 [Pelagibacteraceae bacterium]|jgi:hypothetical protein|nr:hypothetical protein [Pelagibacteraceae bacterium]